MFCPLKKQRGISTMAVCGLPKAETRVRFPYPARNGNRGIFGDNHLSRCSSADRAIAS